MKRYSHPKHGFHVAAGHEAIELVKNGWAECGWETAKAAPEVSPEVTEVVIEDAPKRRGRPPKAA